MGKTKVKSKSTLNKGQQTALDEIMKQSAETTNYLSDYLKNMIEQGPDSYRTQQAVNLYKQQVLPQILGNLGEGRSSSALNQALAQGAQGLTENLAADTMQAVDMLQRLTQGNTATGLGTNALMHFQSPSTLAQVLSGVSQLGGLGLNFAGRFFPQSIASIPDYLNTFINFFKRKPTAPTNFQPNADLNRNFFNASL